MGYVFGVLIFFCIIGYWILNTVVRGATEIVYAAKSRTAKNFTTDRINISVESQLIKRMRDDGELHKALREVSRELGYYAFFKYEHLLELDRLTQEDIAEDYLLSKQGLVRRYMAEMGCYRIPNPSPQIVCDAMRAYIQLLQKNIQNKTGTTIWAKEQCWAQSKEYGRTKNYVWVDSPADKDWWSAGKNLTSGYKCIYRKNSP